MRNVVLTVVMATLHAAAPAFGAEELPPTLKLVSSGPAAQVRTDRYVLHSERVGRDLLVEVTQPGPPGFQSADAPLDPGRKFPAIYALDGGFQIVGPATRLLTALGVISPAFVVAIGYPNESGVHIGPREVDLIHVHVAQPSPDGRPAGDGGAAFEAFLLNDLRPYLESRYPLDPQQAILFGHSLGGLFAATVLVTKPEAFGGYVIGSPALGNDLSILEKAKAVAARGDGRRVFITSAPQDLAPTRAAPLATALSGAGSTFLVRHRIFQNLGHGSSYLSIPQTAFPFLLPPTTVAGAARKAVVLDPATLRRYAGRYQLAANQIVKVTAENTHLFAQLAGQPEFELFAASETEFFARVADVVIKFKTDAEDRVSELVLRQNGRDLPAPRVGD